MRGSAGDLMAALLLARLDQNPDDLRTAVELATASLQGIVIKTHEASSRDIGPNDSLPQVSCLLQLPTWRTC